MKRDMILQLTTTFEGHAQQAESGVEYWLARDLQHLLGYAKWDNFLNVVSKAKTACEGSNHRVSDHFADVGKMVDLGSGSQREVEDLMLTRYACYLIAQNGDPKKPEIAFAQSYFAIQTRRAELIEEPHSGDGADRSEAKADRDGEGAFPCDFRAHGGRKELCDHPQQRRSGGSSARRPRP